MTQCSNLTRALFNRITQPQPRNQAGFGMGSMLAAVAILFLVYQGFSEPLARYRATPRVNETAAHLEKVSLAAAQYIQDNYAPLTSTLTLNGPATTVTTTDLRDTGYLSQAHSDLNPYSQGYSLRIRYVTQGTGANQRNVLEPMVLTEGGQPIPDHELLRIAGKLKAGGSIRSSDPTLAVGNNGGWQVPVNAFGANPGAGHLAVGMFYSDAGMLADYLYRNAVPGRPEVNQMNTDIDMAGSSVQNAEVVQTAEAHLTRIVTQATACSPDGAIARNAAGTPMLCENGLWNQSATLNWVDGEGQRMQMTAANGQTIWLQNQNGKYRWMNGTWSSELASVDQSGNFSAGGRIRSGEYMHIVGVAVEGQACSPNGLIGRDAAGLILSCRSGIWKKPESIWSESAATCGYGYVYTGGACRAISSFAPTPPATQSPNSWWASCTWSTYHIGGYRCIELDPYGTVGMGGAKICCPA